MLGLLMVGCGGEAGTQTSGETSTDSAPTERSADADDTGDAATAESVAGKQVTFVSPLIGHPVWLQAKDAFEATAAELGMDPTWVGPQGVDIPGQVQMLESAIASGADGIATCPLDPTAFSGALQSAQEKGIPVIAVTCQPESPDQVTAYVGTIGETFGQNSGEKLIELTDGEAQIIVMQGSLDAQNQNEILGGFKDAISGEEGMEIIAREADNSDVQVAIEKFQALFRTYPDADVVYCIEASCAGAAATVAEEQGILDQLLIFGTDDTAETLAGIRAGTIEITAAQAFPEMGRLAAEYLAASFEGDSVPPSTDTGVVFITDENVDTYLD
jgi:ribose transport system substrate-binding protein